jgi:hypothetical protein
MQLIIDMTKQCEFRRKKKFFFLSNLIYHSFDALVQRYEPPEGRNRWDAPLFELTPNDELPLEQISDYLANKRPPPPNKSTVNVSLPYQFSVNEIFNHIIIVAHIGYQFFT